MLKNLFKTKSARVIAWIIAILAVGTFVYFTAPRAADVLIGNDNEQLNGNLPSAGNVNSNTNINAPKTITNKPAPKAAGFTEKKAPHFVSASIANNATLTQAPTSLTINFDTALSKSTQTVLTVKKDDVTSATRNTASIDNKSLTVGLNSQVTDGDYYVYYVACFADTGCKDGRFGYRLSLP